MSVISANIGAMYGQGLRPVSRSMMSTVAVSSRPNANAASTGSGFSRHDLLEMNAGVDDATRLTNSLSTASDAIGVIGGMLGNIQSVLSAAAPGSGQPVDPATEQSRIDGAITTIDALASSTQFGGKRLLDGTFSLTRSGNSLSLPSFLSSTLGTTKTQTSSLDSLKSGGANDLNSGNHTAASQIITSALSQIAGTQIQISGYLSGVGALNSTTVQLPSAAVPGDDTTADAMYTMAAQMLNEPNLASLAAANSRSQSVLALLQF